MRYPKEFDDWNTPRLNLARIKYAASLYDIYREVASEKTAFSLATKKACVSGLQLRQYLPKHNRRKRLLRNMQIIELRASGNSINCIADSLGISRDTVRRVIDDQADKLAAARVYSGYKIRGCLKYGDPRRIEKTGH